jgi:hypothetical protein
MKSFGQKTEWLCIVRSFLSAHFHLGERIYFASEFRVVATGSSLPMNGHRACWNGRYLAMRFDAPALGHAVAARREAEKRR